MNLTNKIHFSVTSQLYKRHYSYTSGAAVYFSVTFVQQPTEVIVSCLENTEGICKEIVVILRQINLRLVTIQQFIYAPILVRSILYVIVHFNLVNFTSLLSLILFLKCLLVQHPTFFHQFVWDFMTVAIMAASLLHNQDSL